MSLINRMNKSHDTIKGIIGTVSAGLSVGTTYLDALEFWVRIMAGFIGCLVSLAMLISIVLSIIKKHRIYKLEYSEAEANRCRECQAGAVPVHCPIPDRDRPADCPLKGKP